MTDLIQTILFWCAVAGVLLVLTYTYGMFLESAGLPRPPTPEDRDFTVVFLIPCLNEERVIGGTLANLLGVAPPDSLIVVIDDDSDDGTANVVYEFADPRIRLLRRTPPDARLGKGEGLNHAVEYLLTPGGPLAGRSADRVVICLVDADGRMSGGSVHEVLPYFADPAVGGVQIGVRIGNRGRGLLARLQDMEFVLYTRVFQRTRGRLGAAGLGGNGQFVRLGALLELGDRPWSRSLTEDLDLGVRLILAGRRILCDPRVEVEQQGLTSPRRLVRQRSRWFQGHLQAWRLVPEVVRRSRGRVAADLLHVLLSPLLIFAGSFLTLSLLSSLVGAGFSAEARDQMLEPLPIAAWYALTFAPAYLLGPLYARATGEFGGFRALLYGHLFVFYALMWLVAGWWALGRAVLGRRTWLKTERVAEEPQEPPAGGARADIYAGDTAAGFADLADGPEGAAGPEGPVRNVRR